MANAIPGHVAVRVRDADNADTFSDLTTWPIDDLDRLVELFGRWGNPLEAGVSGQFACDPHDVWYFELVVGDF